MSHRCKWHVNQSARDTYIVRPPQGGEPSPWPRKHRKYQAPKAAKETFYKALKAPKLIYTRLVVRPPPPPGRVSPGPIPATPRWCPPRENGAVL